MNGILVDTNGYVAFMNGNLDAIDLVNRAPLVALNAVALGELQIGIALGSKPAENQRRLAAFLGRPGVVCLSLDEDTSVTYSAIAVALRRLGRPIPTNDLWIAASALQHELSLFTLDQHFHAIEGLHIVTKIADLNS